jgi:ubiquinone/menaquinone biosynthesis C-methylase UbiE
VKNIKQTPVRFYDRIAPIYDVFAARNLKPYREIIQRLEIEPGKSALEAGCGTGNLTVPLAEAMQSVVSVDFSTKMLARATEKLAARSFTNVTFQKENVFDLTPEAYGKHHYVFIAFILHILSATDRPLLLSTIVELATERVVVIDYAPHCYRLRYAIIEWAEKSHYKEFLKSDLPAQAAMAGLELVRHFRQADFGVWEFKPVNQE